MQQFSETLGTRTPQKIGSSPFQVASASIMRNNKAAATISSTNDLGGTFDRSTHKPFRLDGRGFNKDLTIKDQDKAVADSYGANAPVKIPA